MSGNEILWRIDSKLQDASQWYQFKRGLLPTFDDPGTYYTKDDFDPGLRFCDVVQNPLAKNPDNLDMALWRKNLLEKAKRLLRHEFSFFDNDNIFIGDPIDWNRDHGNGKAAPIKYAQSIDYRDFEVTGDCKLVWEPNRHHQLVVLARAYRVTGDLKYAWEVVHQIESWLEQCPFGIGMNWRSPMELSIRMINWVWAIDLILDSGVISDGLKVKLINAVHLHVMGVSRKYSRGSSANNHLIGEAAGVFIATSYFYRIKDAKVLCNKSKEILEQEVVNQSYDDGGGREQALGYQLFVLQFFILSGVVGKKKNNDFTAQYWSRVEKMMEFVGRISEGGNLPLFGDSDDGYVLDLGSTCYDYESLLAIGAILFNRNDFKAWSRKFQEPCLWLLGDECAKEYDDIRVASIPMEMESYAFESSGLFLLQSGKQSSPKRISILFDCGELGLGAIAAHGHADALSFSMRVGGADILVDPGSYDYFTYPEWRQYFKSTRAHNAVVVDDTDQSEMIGSFIWGKKAQAKCLNWEATYQTIKVAGEHDGYSRLKDPVIHRRYLELDREKLVLKVKDELITEGKHAITIHFHYAENCNIESIDGKVATIGYPNGKVIMKMCDTLSISAIHGEVKPIGGWISNGYHKKKPINSVIASGTIHGNTFLETMISIYTENE
jgi:hypothetical protein